MVFTDRFPAETALDTVQLDLTELLEADGAVLRLLVQLLWAELLEDIGFSFDLFGGGFGLFRGF